MLNWLAKNKILIKLKKEKKQPFLNAWDQYEQCLDIEQRLDDSQKRSFSEAFHGIAYEFFVLGLKAEGIEISRKIHPQNFLTMIDSLDDEIRLVVFTVFYANVKDDEYFKNNYFFQSMEGRLELLKPRFPENSNLHFKAFIDSWQKVFGPLEVSNVLSVDAKTGKTKTYKKISSK